MQRNCPRCERKVKREENWLHAPSLGEHTDFTGRVL